MKRLLLIAVIVLSVSSVSYAWNYEGHMTLVIVAYGTFTDDEREAIDAALQFHPAYADWQNDFQQLGTSAQVTLPAYAFYRAANWADEIRETPEDRPTWHYINFPLKPPNTLNTNVSIAGALLTQIRNNLDRTATQPTSNAKKVRRAIALSWILHLVGDLHQPLHTGALRNSKYPQGDRGGNLFFIRPRAQAPGIKLHTFWDGVLGQSRDVNVILAFAKTITDQFPASSLSGETGGDYRSWAAESAKLALDVGYQFTPPGGTPMPIAGSKSKNTAPVLPDGYEKTSRQVARRRMALGGYRLGNMLKEVF